MSELNFDADLEIDVDALDEEWLKQPQLFMSYCKAAVLAESAAKKAELNVKTVRSEIIAGAIEQASKAGEKQPTGVMLEAFYRAHKEHIEAKEEWIEATTEADMLRNAIFAFQQRKTALEQLVLLHGQQYFAGPSVPHILDMDSIRAARHGQSTDALKSRGNKKRQSSRRTK